MTQDELRRGLSADVVDAAVVVAVDLVKVFRHFLQIFEPDFDEVDVRTSVSVFCDVAFRDFLRCLHFGHTKQLLSMPSLASLRRCATVVGTLSFISGSGDIFRAELANQQYFFFRGRV